MHFAALSFDIPRRVVQSGRRRGVTNSRTEKETEVERNGEWNGAENGMKQKTWNMIYVKADSAPARRAHAPLFDFFGGVVFVNYAYTKL